MYGHDDISNISIKLIKIINEYNIPCYILTKGILPKELIQLNKINFYGITYVSNNEDFTKLTITTATTPIASIIPAIIQFPVIR